MQGERRGMRERGSRRGHCPSAAEEQRLFALPTDARGARRSFPMGCAVIACWSAANRRVRGSRGRPAVHRDSPACPDPVPPAQAAQGQAAKAAALFLRGLGRRRRCFGRLRRFRFGGRLGLVAYCCGLEPALGLPLPGGPLEGLLSLRHCGSSVVWCWIEYRAGRPSPCSGYRPALGRTSETLA
jgi:hypothetical protein